MSRERSVFCQLGIKEEICILIEKIISKPMQEFDITGAALNLFLRSSTTAASH